MIANYSYTNLVTRSEIMAQIEKVLDRRKRRPVERATRIRGAIPQRVLRPELTRTDFRSRSARIQVTTGPPGTGTRTSGSALTNEPSHRSVQRFPTGDIETLIAQLPLIRDLTKTAFLRCLCEPRGRGFAAFVTRLRIPILILRCRGPGSYSGFERRTRTIRSRSNRTRRRRA